jgi:AhpC/TSA family
MSQSEPVEGVERQRHGRYIGLLGLLILVLITLNTILTKPNGASGIEPGQQLAPFAVPLALSQLNGYSDVATRADEGQAGNVPACKERGPQILNICELYEQGPVVLALFVNAAACTEVLDHMQALTSSFPDVRFAAVSIKNSRGQLRRFIQQHHLSIPIGYDRDGSLVALYKVASCPQVTFAYRGGVVQSKALLTTPTMATLLARVAELLSAARIREKSGTG